MSHLEKPYMLSYIIKQIIKKEETSISKLKTQHLKHRMWVPNSGFVSMLLIIRFWTQYKGQKMQDIKKNTNNKKMSSNITFILFLCTSDFFFFLHTPMPYWVGVISCVTAWYIFLFGFTGCKTDILISQRRYGFITKGLKLGCFSPITIAITDDTQFSGQNYLYFNLIL